MAFTSFNLILKASPVYARPNNAAAEIEKLIWVESYFGNFSFLLAHLHNAVQSAIGK